MGCAHIYAGEMVIDIIKHAVLGKFNEIRYGMPPSCAERGSRGPTLGPAVLKACFAYP